MKKIFSKLFAIIALLSVSLSAKAIGWPANYEGVMLQGFYWDSNNETSWAQLTSQADELSTYFKLIWVPNSAKSNGSPAMGYMPIYWFTNHNSSFGTESQLKKMISTFKEKGTGIIEDVVVNHRVGTSNWYNFPAETWNGKTYQLTDGAICSTDEMWKEGGKGCPYAKGNADTGEDFNGGRDLDHTNTTVQAHIKDYCKFLLDDLGYVGFRLDMVKGYGGQYTKIYNQYSKPQFCVGEYWDGNYDAVAAWIEATGKESAAFDFPAKYQINKAFQNNDMRELVWNANGTTPQPAGLIHFGYPQLSVTFVDNHDTYRDNGNKFPSDANIMAANAFILCSPGTPCVFWKHYVENKTAMQALIKARNSVGVHNMSKVEVTTTNQNCYMAKVTGTKGSLIVKIGSASVSAPSGYTLAASGTNYAVWTSSNGGDIPVIPSPDPFTVYLKNTKNWETPTIHYWGGASESKWPGVAMSLHKDNIWKYTVVAGTTGIIFNAGDGDATKTNDLVAIANHLYDCNGNDLGVYSDGGNNDNPGNYPAKLYLMGHVNSCGWDPSKGVSASGDKGLYTWSNVTVDNGEAGDGFFAFGTGLGSNNEDWAGANSSDRYGAVAEDAPISLGGSADITLYAANVSASGCKSWKLAAGKYDIQADLSSMKVKVGAAGTLGVSDAIVESDEPVEYYNLQGIRVEEPSNGIYIRRQGSSVTKVYIK